MKFNNVVEDVTTLMKQKEMALRQKSNIEKKIFDIDKQIENERKMQADKQQNVDPNLKQNQQIKQPQQTQKPTGFEVK